MSRIVSAAITGLCLAGIAFLGAGAFFVIHATRDLDATSQQAQKTLQNSAGAIDNLNNTLTAINRPCNTGKPCGTLADVAKTLGTIRGAAGQVELTAHHEYQRIDVLDAQEAAIASKTEGSLDLLGDALRTTNTTIAGFQPLQAQLTEEAVALESTTNHLNDVISDPNIPGFFKHGNEIATNIDDMTGDAKVKFHAILFPAPCKTLGCRMARVYPYVKGIAQLGEASYWIEQLFQNNHP